MENRMFDKRGFSLVEVLTTLALIALVIVPVLASVAQSSVFSKRLDMTYYASYLAQRRIELLKSIDFTLLYPDCNEQNIGIDINGDGISEYKRTTEITQNYAGSGKLLKIKVTVTKVLANLNGSYTGMGTPIVMETIVFKGFD
ncbi:MAG: type II secretion system protein [Candidatus Omnitrophica bacterium]|nr:type II secretion system protein [Candidatus Omnitrophota bacterium]